MNQYILVSLLTAALGAAQAHAIGIYGRPSAPPVQGPARVRVEIPTVGALEIAEPLDLHALTSIHPMGARIDAAQYDTFLENMRATMPKTAIVGVLHNQNLTLLPAEPQWKSFVGRAYLGEAAATPKLVVQGIEQVDARMLKPVARALRVGDLAAAHQAIKDLFDTRLSD